MTLLTHETFSKSGKLTHDGSCFCRAHTQGSRQFDRTTAIHTTNEQLSCLLSLTKSTSKDDERAKVRGQAPRMQQSWRAVVEAPAAGVDCAPCPRYA